MCMWESVSEEAVILVFILKILQTELQRSGMSKLKIKNHHCKSAHAIERDKITSDFTLFKNIFFLNQL